MQLFNEITSMCTRPRARPHEHRGEILRILLRRTEDDLPPGARAYRQSLTGLEIELPAKRCRKAELALQAQTDDGGTAPHGSKSTMPYRRLKSGRFTSGGPGLADDRGAGRAHGLQNPAPARKRLPSATSMKHPRSRRGITRTPRLTFHAAVRPVFDDYRLNRRLSLPDVERHVRLHLAPAFRH